MVNESLPAHQEGRSERYPPNFVVRLTLLRGTFTVLPGLSDMGASRAVDLP
jgi:hypothetical protein